MQNFKIRHVTLAAPLSGLMHDRQARLGTKFEVPIYIRYEDMKSGAQCTNWGSLGRLRVTQGHRHCHHHSIQRVRFLFNTNYVSILYHFRDIASYLSKFADLNLPHLRLAPPLGVTLVEFRWDLWRQKTGVPGLSCGVVCMIRLAVSVEHRLPRDRQTNRQRHSI